MYEKIQFTFKNGNRVEFGKGEWDDYSYDGSFFSVEKNGVTIAMYNSNFVFSVNLI